MTTTRLERIRELFILLKKAYIWSTANQDNWEEIEALYDRAKPIVDELETLEVGRTFSSCILVFGPLITDQLVDQFKDRS